MHVKAVIPTSTLALALALALTLPQTYLDLSLPTHLTIHHCHA